MLVHNREALSSSVVLLLKSLGYTGLINFFRHSRTGKNILHLCRQIVALINLRIDRIHLSEAQSVMDFSSIVFPLHMELYPQLFYLLRDFLLKKTQKS